MLPDDGVPPIRVFIADKHRVVRTGLALEIGNHQDLQLVGEGVNGREVLGLVADQWPDVLVLDVIMPGMNGVQLTHQLHSQLALDRPSSQVPRVLVFSACRDRQYVWSMLAAGARGYLLKSEPPARVVEAIRALNRGEVMLSAAIQSLLVEMIPLLQRQLSIRETEVLQLLAKGMSDSEIAEILKISESTVRSHLNGIYRKVPVLRTRAEAVAWAWVNQLNLE